MRIRFIMPLFIVISMQATFNCSALAADKQELQERFEKRYPELLKAKTEGKVGETLQGTIDAVDPKAAQDASISKLIKDENSDRHELYKLIAAEEKVSEGLVAERTAKRNYEKARAGEYLKSADGSWKKKS